MCKEHCNCETEGNPPRCPKTNKTLWWDDTNKPVTPNWCPDKKEEDDE